MARITPERMVGVLGPAKKPSTVWQKQFDGDDETLRRLAGYRWDEAPDEDLWCYIHDLTYVPLQPDLFRHVFPRCLKFWYDTLLRDEGAEIGDADFHRALIRGDAPNKLMSEDERQRLLAFFVDGQLDRIDLESDFSHQRPGAASQSWIGRFNTLGLVAPIVPELWKRWWSLGTHGQAVAAIKYASGLIYFADENPIYLPWTPDEGGGGPYLTEWDAGIYDQGWLEPNLTFLRETLTCDYIVDRVSAAARALQPSPEAAKADEVAKHAAERGDIISLRIDDLIANLAKASLEHEPWR